MNSPSSLPSRALLAEQSQWLAGARARLLRKAAIAHRKKILDLGAGYGAVVPELARRAAPGALVVGLDVRAEALAQCEAGAADRVCGNALRLPFADAALDLVYAQFSLLWANAAAAIGEIARVLAPPGVCAAIEPDYGGMIEHPPEIAVREVWLSALRRAGAEPEAGRALPALFRAAGFRTQVDLLDRLDAPSPQRFTFLSDLPLTKAERERVAQAQRTDERIGAESKVAHLPLFLIIAEKPR